MLCRLASVSAGTPDDCISDFIGASCLPSAPAAGGGEHAVAQAHSHARCWKVAAAVLAEQALQMVWHPDSHASAYLAGDLNIPIASIRVQLALLCCQVK
jgi:hypothetical protein